MLDADLKRLCVLITGDLRGSFGDEALGPTFPKNLRSMTHIRNSGGASGGALQLQRSEPRGLTRSLRRRGRGRAAGVTDQGARQA